MMKVYADCEYYYETYHGSKLKDGDSFNYWMIQATSIIRNLTFGRIDQMEIIPEEVQMCCCEVAEKLYAQEAAKEENGMILQSYGNDGETGTFKVDELSEEAVQKSTLQIVRKWLARTGLMYCGVM